MPTHNLDLDVHKRTSLVPPQVVCRQGEAGSETIEANLLDDGVAYTPDFTAGRLDMLHADGTWARVTATISGSTISATLPGEALSSAGRCKMAHFVLEDSTATARVTTEGFELIILPCVDPTGQQAQDYDNRIEDLLQKWFELEAEAEAAEAQRQANESDREDAEAQRQANEAERQAAEAARRAAETGREQAEETREAQEAARVEAELARAAAEAARVQAESARVVAEEDRETRFTEIETVLEGALVSSIAGVEATTLPAGSDATVALEDAVLAFGIPQGIQGEQGVQGEAGHSSYLHVRYSDDGGQTFSEGTGAWLGTLVDESETASDDPADYTWVHVEGKPGETWYAVCADAETEAERTVEVSGFELYVGATLAITMESAAPDAPVTLNAYDPAVAEESRPGARALCNDGEQVAGGAWRAGATIYAIYDGEVWQMIGNPIYSTEVTVGMPSGVNVHVNSDLAEIRDGGTALATFGPGGIGIGGGLAIAIDAGGDGIALTSGTLTWNGDPIVSSGSIATYLTGYATQSWVTSTLGSYATQSWVSSNYATPATAAQSASVIMAGSDYGELSLSSTSVTQCYLNTTRYSANLNGNFTVTGGGVQCNFAGLAMVTGSVYIEASETQDAMLGCYVRLGSTEVGSWLGSARQPSCGPLLVSVSSGSMLYLYGRRYTSGSATMYRSNAATYLLVQRVS